MARAGFPIQSPGVWRGPEIDWKKEGLHVLSETELAEIDRALAHLLSKGRLDLPEITPETFPLHRMGDFMRALPARLAHGVGFLMLRGLPRRQYSDDDMLRIYAGLGSYISAPMVQSYLGDLIGHVVDVSDVEPKSRGYRKGGGQLMHTDSCDIIGLMCLRTALSGGESRISSALAVFNEIAEKRPDVLEILERGLWLKRADEDGRHATSTYSRDRVPFITRHEGNVICYLPTGYARLCEKSGQRPYTQEESDALYHVRKVAASPEFYLDMGFAEGDIQFLNNRMIVHGRTDYQDAESIHERRHLLRMWMSVAEWPAMPDEQIFHTAEDHRLWARNRVAFSEFPSEHDARLEQLRREGAAMMD
jgi:hypothetical protein